MLYSTVQSISTSWSV